MTFEKPVPKWLGTPANYNRSKQCDKPIRFLANAYDLFKVREKSRSQSTAIGFCFASHWLKNLFKIFMVFTFDSYLKTALYM